MSGAVVRREHRMPFGAQLEADGVRFRLWAPAARDVALMIEDGGSTRAIAMAPVGEGWHALHVPGASAGTPYAFRVDDGPAVPDPASRCNPDDVHGASLVTDPKAFAWHDPAWRGRPWHEAALYELHVGAFTPQGSFAAAIDRLDDLAALGITVIELMPVADFAGRRNWGYDGVLPFAPEASYGPPEDLKRLVEAAHARGLAVLLDVVYNHFGPDGNHLPRYAPQFFHATRHTPWGAAIDFVGPHARIVRDFCVHNALYWIEEFHIDGLRLDAVETIRDSSRPDIVEEIAQAIHAGPGRERHVHLVLENRRLVKRHLARAHDGRLRCATAQWNDDLHHAAHVLGTGEVFGYYASCASQPLAHFARALATGAMGRHVPTKSKSPARAPLPPTAFVAYLQNHDQVGNRPFGDRLTRLMPMQRLQVLMACVLLAPSVPMLFMGEDWGATTPFLFFCDFEGDLARTVDAGRRRGFARVAGLADALHRTDLADPNDPATFAACTLDWTETRREVHAQWRAFVRRLLALRRAWITPRLAGMRTAGRFEVPLDDQFAVCWTLGDGRVLRLDAHLPRTAHRVARELSAVRGTVIHEIRPRPAQDDADWSARWVLEVA